MAGGEAEGAQPLLDLVGEQVVALEDSEHVNAVTLDAVNDSIGPDENLTKVGTTSLANDVAGKRELSCSARGSKKLVDPPRGRAGVVGRDVVVDRLEVA